MASEAYVISKWENLFEFISGKKADSMALADFVEPACRNIKVGKVEAGAMIAKMFKQHWDRVFHAIGKPESLLEINKDDWVKGQLIVSQSEWYRTEFISILSNSFFDTMDLNNDDKVNLEEWRIYYHSQRVYDEEFIQTTFRKMDANGDGYISREEFEKAGEIFVNRHEPNNDYSFLFIRN